MKESLSKIFAGYQAFREKYAKGDDAIMKSLANLGQKPEFMVVACSDSRVDPALILQCDPGDLFVVRNVANIIPPFEKDKHYHGTSAALEFGICYLKVKHLIILGHSHCGGIQALLNQNPLPQDDFISKWVSVIQPQKNEKNIEPDNYAQLALKTSQQNAMTFPWIEQKVMQNELLIHLWYFNIKEGKIMVFNQEKNSFSPMKDMHSYPNM